MIKIKKSYRFNKKIITKIEQLAIEKKISHTAAIEYMIGYYFENRSKQQNELIRMILEMKEDLKRIRVTGNVIDRDTKMMLEFWNHHFVVNDFKELATTEKYKTEELKEAETLVKKRIAHNRQRKIDWENKRRKVSNQTNKEVK